MYKSRTFAHLIGDPVVRPWLYVQSIVRVMRRTQLEVTSLVERSKTTYAPASFAVPQQYEVVVSPSDYDRLASIGIPRVVATVAGGLNKFATSHRGSIYRNSYNKRLAVTFSVDTERDLPDGHYYICCQSPCRREGPPARLTVWYKERYVTEVDLGYSAAVSVGRGRGNHIRLERARQMGRLPFGLHLWFVWEGDHCVLINKGSCRRVRVGETKMGRGQVVPLSGGDVIEVGKRIRMHFALDKSEGEAAMSGRFSRFTRPAHKTDGAALHFWGYVLRRSMFAEDGQGQLALGSGRESDLLLTGSDVAPQHARLTLQDGAVCMESPSVETPLFVDGRPVDFCKLHEGARIRIGSREFHFTCGAGDAAAKLGQVLEDDCVGFLVFGGRSADCTVPVPGDLVRGEGEGVTVGNAAGDFVRLGGRQMEHAAVRLERYDLQWLARTPANKRPVVVGFDHVVRAGQSRALSDGDVLLVGPLVVEFRAA